MYAVSDMLWYLASASLYLTVTAAIAMGLLRMLRIQSITIRATVLWIILLEGVVLIPVRVSIPWAMTNVSNRQLTIASDHAERTAPEQVSQLATGLSPAVPDAAVRLEPSRMAWGPSAIVATAWLAGVVLILTYWTCIYIAFVCKCSSMPCDRLSWCREWESIQQAAQIKNRIPMYISVHVGPLLCRYPTGYRLVVPYSLWASLSETQRACIMRHELAHYRRADVWSSLFAHLFALPHWFNPVVWLCVRELGACSEFLCDDEVGRIDPRTITEYAKALLMAGQHSHVYPVRTAIGGGSVPTRVRRLLSAQPTPDSFLKQMAVLAVACGFLLVHAVRPELVPLAEGAEAPDRPSAEAMQRIDEVLAFLNAPESLRQNAVLCEAVAGEYIFKRDMQKSRSGMTPAVDELLRKLHDSLAAADTPPFDHLEALASQLKDNNISLSELGLVYLHMSELHHKHGRFVEAIRWARQALACPLNRLDRVRAFRSWVDSAHVLRGSSSEHGEAISTACPVFLGLMELAQWQLPVDGIEFGEINRTRSESADAAVVQEAGWLKECLQEFVLVQNQWLDRAQKQFAPHQRPGEQHAFRRALHELLHSKAIGAERDGSKPVPGWIVDGRTMSYATTCHFPKILPDFGRFVDVIARDKGLFQASMDGLQRDPAGPQIDIVNVVNQLGSELIVVADDHGAGDRRHERILLAVEVQDEKTLHEGLERIGDWGLAVRRSEVGKVTLWTLMKRTDGSSGILPANYSICIAGGYLLIADHELLIDTLKRIQH